MAIIRSMKASPGFTLTRTTSQSDSTRVPPVTAEKSPPAFAHDGRGLAGDRALIDRCDAFDDLAVGRDHMSPSLDQEEIALAQLGCGYGSPLEPSL